MGAYTYHTVWPAHLRVGDEIRAADGKTWLAPVRHAKRETASAYGISVAWAVWTDTRPGYGPPNHRIYEHSKLRVRRLK